MDPKTGIIYHVDDEAEARRRGLIPIPPSMEREVRAMNRHERRKWAAQQKRRTGKG
jgi:hypothetical protein